ncbi:transcriptional regulator of the myo-inositol catabolic operon [Cutibacterium acnes JCM 18918]|nr:transcriptional regulator of the myo-inositol catabolic operon [Cutibacterium acnes JCM 18918]
MGTASDDTRHEEAVLRRFREFRAVGVIVVSPVGDLESLAALSGPTSPLVLLGAENQSGVVPCVHVDEDTAAQLIVEHLAHRECVALSLWLRNADRGWCGCYGDAQPLLQHVSLLESSVYPQ